jgi:hypothetical protein
MKAVQEFKEDIVLGSTVLSRQITTPPSIGLFVAQRVPARDRNQRSKGRQSWDTQLSMMRYDRPILILFNENICHSVVENDAMPTQRSGKAQLIGAD